MARTILLVEREPSLRKNWQEHLEASGYTTFVSASAKDALALCEYQQASPDLLITDVVLTGMNGLHLAQRLTRIHPDMKVLFISAYLDHVDVQAVRRSQELAFLAKPVAWTELSDKVRELLGDLTR